MSAAAGVLGDEEPSRRSSSSPTSSSPTSPPLTALEIKYLLGNASREEAAHVRDLFAKRSQASPEGVFVCGSIDDP